MAINWIDVTASPYNAAGDGTTDDTSAIQSAINAAGSNGVVYFPALTYKTSGTLTAAYDNHTWLMYGATILADFDGIAVRFGSFSAAKQNNSVYGGNIYRTSSPSSTGWTIGNIGWQWLNFSRFYHVDYQIRGFHIGQQLLGEGLAIDEVDITINSPAEFTTSVSHNLVAGNIVYFSTTGTLPTGLDEETPYYVVAAGLTGTTFRVSSTSDLMNVVTTTGSQSGTHTLWRGITFGTQSGHLVPRHLLSNKVGISCTARNGGWCNENAFFGAGRVGNLSSDPDQSAGYMIHLERGQRTPNLLNNNKFYGLCLENAKSSNKPKAVYCDAIYTLFDHCRYEGFDADFIDNSGDDFLSGGNIFRGGIGLTTPGDCLVDPTVGLYQFVGARASVHGGGSSTEAAWAVRDLNSANNKSFRVQNTDGTDWFKIDGLGRTEIGFNSGGSLDAKLAVINDSFSTKTMVLRQKASPVGPAIEVQKSAGNPVFTVRKNTSGSATEDDMIVVVGALGDRLDLDEDPLSGVVARGQIGAVGAASTAAGIPGVVVLANDDGVAATANKPLGVWQCGGNPSTSTFGAIDAILISADGEWDDTSGLVAPTRTVFSNGSTTADQLVPYLEATSANEIGFLGATPVSRPEISSSTGGNAALEDLLAALHSLGLITDST